MSAVLSVRDLNRVYRDKNRPEAMPVGVRGVSFDIARGEVVGLIGESGCGKSTLARCITRLDTAESGEVLVNGEPFGRMTGAALRAFRRHVQIVFQRPETALNPRMTALAFVREVMRNFRIGARSEERSTIERLAGLLGLRPETLERYPHQLSGGERQRVAILRAIACEPSLVVLDEPTSALDVSVQAQVLRRLRDLQRELGTSFLFISHDVAVIRYMCSRVMVMYLGKIIEEGPAEAVFSAPAHPYTRALIAASPRITPQDQEAPPLKGELVLGDVAPTECPLRPRCPLAHDRCGAAPPVRELGGGHRAACWLAGEADVPPIPIVDPEGART